MLKDKHLHQASDAFGKAEDRKVFACLLAKAVQLGIREVHQCDGCWADGYLIMQDGRTVAIESKRALGWNQLCNGVVQLLSLRGSLRPEANEGWFIYRKIDSAWLKKGPAGAIAHAQHCLSALSVQMSIQLVHLDDRCNYNTVHGTR
jgi:hypothetical protein